MTETLPPPSAPEVRQGWFSNWEARDLAPLISLAVLVLFFSFAADGFLKLNTLRLILQQGAVLGIVATGLTFVLLCGEIDLSVGTVALWTACACGVLSQELGPTMLGSTAIAIIFPLVTALLFGLLSGVLTVSSRLPSFIITLAMMYIATGLSRYITASQSFDLPPLLQDLGIHTFNVGGLSVPASALLTAAILIKGHIVLQHTRFGRYVYMTGGNREAARLAGIRTSAIVVACLAICAVTAGLGGLLNAGRMNKVSLDQNADLLLEAVACVVLGGTSLFGGEGGLGKTTIGVLTFMVLRVGLNQIAWIDDLMRPFLMGVVLLVALLINGFLGRRT